MTFICIVRIIKGGIRMKLVFEIEPYEDMLDEPFTTKSYLLD